MTGDYREKLDFSWQLRREKKYREAETVLAEALDRANPESAAYRVLKVNLADVILRQGRADEAREAALEVLAGDPAQVAALTVLGMSALEIKNPIEALENLEKAYGLAPSAFRAGRLARAHELADNPTAALKILAEARQRFPRDPYLLRQHSTLQKRLSPDALPPPGPLSAPPGRDEPEEDSSLYAEMLRARLRSLDAAAAAAELGRLLRVGKRRQNPHLQVLHGDLLREAGDEEGALAAYNLARELDPGNLHFLAQLLYTYRRLGRKEEAWPLLKLLLCRRPGDKTAKASLLKDAVDLNRLAEGIRFFEELLQLNPQHRELYGAIHRLKKMQEHQERGPQDED